MANKETKERRVCLPRDLIESDAARELTGRSFHVLTIFYSKRKFEPDTFKELNVNQISFTYKEARVLYRISAVRFTHAISQLMECGFIDRPKSGGGAEGDKARYGISHRWRKFGESGFKKSARPKDYRKSKSGEEQARVNGRFAV